jgi:hypothetical protein
MGFVVVIERVQKRVFLVVPVDVTLYVKNATGSTTVLRNVYRRNFVYGVTIKPFNHESFGL